MGGNEQGRGRDTLPYLAVPYFYCTALSGTGTRGIPHVTSNVSILSTGGLTEEEEAFQAYDKGQVDVLAAECCNRNKTINSSSRTSQTEPVVEDDSSSICCFGLKTNATTVYANSFIGSSLTRHWAQDETNTRQQLRQMAFFSGVQTERETERERNKKQYQDDNYVSDSNYYKKRHKTTTYVYIVFMPHFGEI
jgi:hypothetical protein